jgi:16S rRNA (adenine1518-N6/adenine1519-N6)-dimethyltransferase
MDEQGARAWLLRHDLRPKKSWGQNFLVDKRVVDAIVGAATLTAEDVVVEIGAGTGAMTQPLAARAGRVLAVERDPDMVTVLRERFADEPRIEVLAQDALALDYPSLARAAGRPLVVMGNLPYQITSPLLFATVDAAAHGRVVARALLMVQKEFADRAVARPGGKIYGRLSVMVQQAADVSIVVKVSPAAFLPQPKVHSSVMKVVPRAQPLARVLDEATFAATVAAAFQGRRKTLRRALQSTFERPRIEDALSASAIDGGRRAETLAVEEFAALANALAAAGVHAPGGHGTRDA